MSRVLCRYVCESSRPLLAALEERGVRYECPEPLPGAARWAVFTVDRARLADRELFELAEAHKISCLLTRQYTKREMEDTRFFTVRCDLRKLAVREDPQTTWVYPCGHGNGVFCRRVQTGPFVCAGPFRWMGQHHWVSETGFSPPLFCDTVTREALEEADLAGVRFLPVFDRDGAEPLPNLHQLLPEKILPREALVLPENGEDCRLKPCPLCGAPHYLLTGAFQLKAREKYLAEGDIFATEALFGDLYARSMIIVSQTFFRLLRDKKLDKNLRFEPVALESA